MNESDRKVFYFDPKTYDWKCYIDDFYKGIGKFIFNDKSIGSVEAQRKLKKYRKFINIMGFNF